MQVSPAVHKQIEKIAQAAATDDVTATALAQFLEGRVVDSRPGFHIDPPVSDEWAQAESLLGRMGWSKDGGKVTPEGFSGQTYTAPARWVEATRLRGLSDIELMRDNNEDWGRQIFHRLKNSPEAATKDLFDAVNAAIDERRDSPSLMQHNQVEMAFESMYLFDPAMSVPRLVQELDGDYRESAIHGLVSIATVESDSETRDYADPSGTYVGYQAPSSATVAQDETAAPMFEAFKASFANVAEGFSRMDRRLSAFFMRVPNTEAVSFAKEYVMSNLDATEATTRGDVTAMIYSAGGGHSPKVNKKSAFEAALDVAGCGATSDDLEFYTSLQTELDNRNTGHYPGVQGRIRRTVAEIISEITA